MRPTGLRTEDLLLAAWNAVGVPLVAVGELITSLTVDETGFGLFIVGMLVAALAASYASLVVAPRMLVDPEGIAGGCLLWPLRFAVYLVSAVLGIGWLAVAAG